jgi:CMP-N,N'-diacetyllegionaminic acid synthase
MKPLVIIPARGGSKGVPGKNIKALHGKPLLLYTIEAAAEVFPLNQICISTDDPNIKAVAESTGLVVPFLRPAYLASDQAGSYEVLLHALEFSEQKGYHPDVVVLLQPTSPFRNAQHIREALQQYSNQLDMLVSVKLSKANPYYNLFEESDSGFLHKSKPSSFTRRQDCPEVYEINGAIYIIRASALKEMPLSQMQKVGKYVMDELCSHDIDTPIDWLMAEKIAEMLKASNSAG